MMKTKTEKILALLDKGIAPKTIAKKMGVSPAYVYVVRSKTKAKTKKKPGRPKKDKWVKTEGIAEAEVAPNKWVEVTIPAEASVPADPVNHPPHYTAGGIETLDFIEAKDLNYRLGNVIKYISRAGKKVDGDPIQDLEKAAFYLNREITVRKGA